MSKLHGRENDTVIVEAAAAKSEVALREEAILAFWQEHDIFIKSIEAPAGGEPKGDYVFYDGPPFATGTPHYGHILASAIKDAIPRFWTMQGYRVRRKWGWDCHGLPLENLIEKKLGLATKRDIEEYGVKNFNEAARAAVMEYADDWAQIMPRMGRFADMVNDYKTMDSSYTESVWWVFKSLHEKGLVFEGFKSMHLCPRCGTTLSNFEVNQGYKDIKDIAVTVKLPLLDESGNPTDTSLLVWTTTPWTLPGNMAAAVHQDFDYLELEIEASDVNDSPFSPGEKIIFANSTEIQIAVLGAPLSYGPHPHEDDISWANVNFQNKGNVLFKNVRSLKGSDLVGRSYQPPFNYWQKQDFEGKDKAWKIYHADYVELGEDGTGAVHLAPAYGDEDMQLAKAHGVPVLHHVDGGGHFKDFVTDFAGQLVKPKDDDEAGISHLDADIEVLKKLQEAGKIFKKENITHSYPHCWRCDTPLLNYATTSWFVNVPKIKDELVAANNTVKWVPEHVGSNRFGRWLEGARDWAVSRQRYWGAPLPIWKNPQTGDYKVFGSLAELQAHVPKSGNTYLLMRHGEAESNLEGRISASATTSDHLTEKGRAQVAKAAAELKDKGVSLIIHSGFERTRMSAELIAAELGLGAESVLIDERLIELQPGSDLEGKSWSDYQDLFVSEEDAFVTHKDGRENRMDVARRAGGLLRELEAKHQDKTILIVGHASSLFGLRVAAAGLTPKEAAVLKAEDGFLANAQVLPLSYVPFPHNDNFELDYHRPYIDDFELVDNDGTRLVRVPDVFDCWFESGSMPYGQHHYPFAGEEVFAKEHFPAQFIAEGLDQTRGWFYSLIVLGTALFGKSPYEHVIVNGLVLAEDGKKMSKKLRNYPDPMELADRVGADAMRYYLLTSPVVRGEDLSFSEKEVLELQRKNIGRLHNVLAMYELYADDTLPLRDSVQVLDKWVLAKCDQMVTDSTLGYESYELDRATRPLSDFIDDVSVWYLRRSRDRLKGDDEVDKRQALSTLRYVLRTLSLVMAPAMPFYAEYLWSRVRTPDDAVSVHLAAWPKAGEANPIVIGEMSLVREFVTAALEIRTRANIKVRQPLSRLTTSVELAPEYAAIVADEVNVKVVEFVQNQSEPVQLNVELTPELVNEGYVRELMRFVQDQRKSMGLAPSDRVVLTVSTDPVGEKLLKDAEAVITKVVGAQELRFAESAAVEALEVGPHRFAVSIQVI